MRTSKLLITSFLILLLSSCRLTPEAETPGAVDRSLEEGIFGGLEPEDKTQDSSIQMPTAIENDMMPSVNVDQKSGEVVLGEERFNIKTNNTDARQFFSSLINDTEYSVAIHPDVSGTITIDLKQVTLDEAFNMLSRMYGFDIQKEGRIYQIYPAGMRTETFAVNYLLMKRQGQSSTNISAGGISQGGGGGGGNGQNQGQSGGGNSANPQGGQQGGTSGGGNGTSISTETETDFWKELADTLNALIGQGEQSSGKSVVVTPQSGLVTVRGYPEDLRIIKKFLETAEEHLQRQVILEARILEITLNEDFEAGIDWQQVLSHAGSLDFQFSSPGRISGSQITGALGGLTSIQFASDNFNGVLRMLSTQGNVHVLSSPRVTATNNQKAVLKAGSDEYFVTNVSTTTVTGNTTSSSPSVSLTPFFSGIALDVTPQIDGKGGVLLHVHPSVVETDEQEKVVSLGNEQIVLPLAQTKIRESDTVIKAASGEIVVIAGLTQSSYVEQESKTPVLGDVPILGELFKNRSKSQVKKELVILIKPTVVGNGSHRKALKTTRDLMRKWYKG